MTTRADKIIVALDVPTEAKALDLVRQLRSHVSYFKVGLQLYTAVGPNVVREIVKSGAKVFLDLKLHDIPNTVAAAVASAAELSVGMLTIHLSGGEMMIRAAVDAAKRRVMIVGVTVLTSHDQQTLGQIGIDARIEDQVLRLAKLGVDCGVGGIVASPAEAAMLRAQFGGGVSIITPGIRPAGAPAGDQKRVTTPGIAIEAGADYLVIGRPIVADPHPTEAIQRILAELDNQ